MCYLLTRARRRVLLVRYLLLTYLSTDTVGAGEVVDELTGRELVEGLLVEGVTPVDVVRRALEQPLEADLVKVKAEAEAEG